MTRSGFRQHNLTLSCSTLSTQISLCCRCGTCKARARGCGTRSDTWRGICRLATKYRYTPVTLLYRCNYMSLPLPLPSGCTKPGAFTNTLSTEAWNACDEKVAVQKVNLITVLTSVEFGSPNSWHMPAASARPEDAECICLFPRVQDLSLMIECFFSVEVVTGRRTVGQAALMLLGCSHTLLCMKA